MNRVHMFSNYLSQIFTRTLRKLFSLLSRTKSTTMSVYIAPITRLSPRVVRILGCNPSLITLQGTNTYLIGSGPKRILVDTGEKNYSEYINNLRNFLHSENIRIEHIIITHWHNDHIGGLDEVSAILPSNDYKVWKYKRCDKKEDTLYKDEVINELQDGQNFILEGATLRIVHTPGHTTDHVVLHLEEENAVFSGDCILGEGTTVFEDLSDYMISLENIKAMKPSTIYPGHGPEIKENVMERIQGYLDHRIKRENDILSVLELPTDEIGYTAADIVEKLYQDKPLKLRIVAIHNVKGHLKKLLKDDRVKIVDDDFYLLKNKL